MQAAGLRYTVSLKFMKLSWQLNWNGWFLQNYARSFNNILTPSTAKPLPSSASMLQSLPHPPQKPKEEYNSAAFGRADVMYSLRVTWPPIWRLVLYQFLQLLLLLFFLYSLSQREWIIMIILLLAACCCCCCWVLLCLKFRFLVGPESSSSQADVSWNKSQAP